MIDPTLPMCRTPLRNKPYCRRADFYADVSMPDGISIWLYGLPDAIPGEAVYVGDTPFTFYGAPWQHVTSTTHQITFDAYKRGYLPQFFDRTISVYEHRLPIKLTPDPAASQFPLHPFLSLGDGTPHPSPVPWIAAGLGVSGLALWWYLRRRGVRG